MIEGARLAVSLPRENLVVHDIVLRCMGKSGFPLDKSLAVARAAEAGADAFDEIVRGAQH